MDRKVSAELPVKTASRAKKERLDFLGFLVLKAVKECLDRLAFPASMASLVKTRRSFQVQPAKLARQARLAQPAPMAHKDGMVRTVMLQWSLDQLVQPDQPATRAQLAVQALRAILAHLVHKDNRVLAEMMGLMEKLFLSLVRQERLVPLAAGVVRLKT